MLKDINKFLKDKTPLFIVKHLKDVDYTCCAQIATQVIDFDAVKDKFFKIVGLGEDCKLCSVDAIYFHRSENALCFIEMKKKDANSMQSDKQFIENYLLKIKHKIVDSYLILVSIMGYYEIDKNLYKAILHQRQFKIKSYILTNLLYKDLLPIQLALQHELNISLSNRIGNNIALLSCDKFDNDFPKYILVGERDLS